MKDFIEYVIWQEKSPDRMIIVPGIHMRNQILEEWPELGPDDVLDMYSLSHYSYPEYEGKTLAFYNWPVCIRDMLNTRYEIVDLESCDGGY